MAGKFDRHDWEIRRIGTPTKLGQNEVGIFCAGKRMASVFLGDALRPESARIVSGLQKLGKEVRLLSGDSRENVAMIAAELGINSWEAALLPEEKAAIVAKSQGTVMVGDGANDAVAFQSAAVGVAMQSAIDLSLKNSDVVLTRPGLEGLLEAVRLSIATMKIVRLNLFSTLFYNSFAGTLAAIGWMEPLWAAILMPLSALTVFSLTQWQTWRKIG